MNGIHYWSISQSIILSSELYKFSNSINWIHTHIHTHTHTHTHTHIYIYIYTYIYIYIYIYIYRQHFFVNSNFIKHNRHFMSTYFLLDPFEFPYYFYRIRGEFIYVLSIVVCIPRTFCTTLGHHQGRICYKKWCNFCFSILLLCKGVFLTQVQ